MCPIPYTLLLDKLNLAIILCAFFGLFKLDFLVFGTFKLPALLGELLALLGELLALLGDLLDLLGELLALLGELPAILGEIL